MGVISLLWGVLALLWMILALIPLLGWGNWFLIPFAAVGAIIAALGILFTHPSKRGRAWTGLVPGKGLEAVLRELRSPESGGGKAPAGLAAQLRPYQLAGYFWLRFATRLGLGACLADDMGLGKVRNCGY